MQLDAHYQSITPMPQIRSKYLYYGPVFTAFIAAIMFLGFPKLVGDVFASGQLHFWPLFILVSASIAAVWLARETYQHFLAVGKIIRLRLWGIPAVAVLRLEDINFVGQESSRGFFWTQHTIRFQYINRSGQNIRTTQSRLPGNLCEILLDLKMPFLIFPYAMTPITTR
jgi:hypothetical protein